MDWVTLSKLFHFSKCFTGCDDGRTLLKNLQETTLGRAITSVQEDGIAVLISDNLHLKMAGILTKLHDEDGTSKDLIFYLDVCIAQIFLIMDESDSLSSTSIRGLDHDTVFVSNLKSCFHGLIDVETGGHLECFIWNGSLFGEFRLQGSIIRSTVGSGPRYRGHLGHLFE